jgi:sortase A
MKTRINSLMVLLGFVVAATMLVSATLDARQMLPWKLEVSTERLPGAPLDSAAAAGKAAVQLKQRTWSPYHRSQLAKAQEQPNSAGDSTAIGTGAIREMLHGAEPVLLPTITPEPEAPEIPARLVIPAIELDAPILPAKTSLQEVRGEEFEMWQAPNEFGAGWHADSALLGQPGNTVMSGHHNIHGKVFERLVDLNPGDMIIIFGTQRAFMYQVTNTMILPEKYQELEVRMENARWIQPSEDERVTLVTCWPAKSNTHRLVIVAKPLGGQ